MSLNIRYSDSWVPVNIIQVMDNVAWENATDGWVMNAGSWERFHGSAAPESYCIMVANCSFDTDLSLWDTSLDYGTSSWVAPGHLKIVQLVNDGFNTISILQDIGMVSGVTYDVAVNVASIQHWGTYGIVIENGDNAGNTDNSFNLTNNTGIQEGILQPTDDLHPYIQMGFGLHYSGLGWTNTECEIDWIDVMPNCGIVNNCHFINDLSGWGVFNPQYGYWVEPGHFKTINLDVDQSFVSLYQDVGLVKDVVYNVAVNVASIQHWGTHGLSVYPTNDDGNTSSNDTDFELTNNTGIQTGTIKTTMTDYHEIAISFGYRYDEYGWTNTECEIDWISIHPQ